MVKGKVQDLDLADLSFSFYPAMLEQNEPGEVP